ncbi:MAG: uracil phosphoribosyltransferase [Pseudomonadota bacterium]
MSSHPDFPNLTIVDHPLVQHKLSRMRQKDTPDHVFRQLLDEIAQLMAVEVTKDLPITTKTIETPIEAMDAPVLAEPYPVIVPILRAGLGMSAGLHKMLPEASIGHVGVYRDEATHKPVEYLVKLPDIADQPVILVDPMLATGGSALFALDAILKKGAKASQIRFMALVGAPEGVKAVSDVYPDLPIYLASLDKSLNVNAFIVPGLGDAGDRIFGTHA